MTRLLDANGEQIESSKTFDVSGDWTLGFWLYAGSVPQATNAHQVSLVDVGDLIPDSGFSYDHSSSSYRQAAYTRDGGSYPNAKLTTSLQANTWYYIAVTYDLATTTLRAWLDGTNEASNVSAGGESNEAANVVVQRTSASASDIQFADVCLWNTIVLSQNEITALSRGIDPRHIRPDILLSSNGCYLPLWGNHSSEIDLSESGATAAVTGATKGTSGPPRTLYTPKWAATVPLIEAAAGDDLVETPADDVGLSETVLLVRAMNRFIAETEELSESALAALEMHRFIAENADLAESILAVLGIVRDSSDTVELAESIAISLGQVRSIADTIELAESIAVSLGQVRSIAETWELAESILVSRSMVRFVNETLTIDESVQPSRVMVRSLADTISISEQALKQLELIRAVGNTLSISDGQVTLLPEQIEAIISLTMPRRTLDFTMPRRSLDLTMPVV